MSNWIFKFIRNKEFTELELKGGEHLLLSGLANKWQRFGNKGGKLFLTDRRLVFKAHAFNFGSKIDEYNLEDIQINGDTVNIKTSSNGILGICFSFNISFYTKSGEKLSFVVAKSQKNEWIQKITEAVSACAFNSRVASGIAVHGHSFPCACGLG